MNRPVAPLSAKEENDFFKVRDEILASLKSNGPRGSNQGDIVGRETMVDRLEGKPTLREIFYFFAPGCEWVSRGGPCLACGHFAITSGGKRVKVERIVEQFHNALLSLPNDREIISLYNAGSFLNEREIPAGARRVIFSTLSAKRNIKRVVIESLPQYITSEKLLELKQLLPDKEIEIGIGVDSVSEKIRRYCVNKSTDLDSQLRVLKKIKSASLLPLCYVLLKPVFLSEEEAIEETIKSIKLLVDKGFERISLEPLSLQPNSFASYLARDLNMYSIPSIWSVQAIVRALADIPVHMRIGGWQYRPKPIESIIYYECPQGCHTEFRKAVNLLNGTGDTHELIELECDCKARWRALCETEPKFDNNVRKFLKLSEKTRVT